MSEGLSASAVESVVQRVDWQKVQRVERLCREAIAADQATAPGWQGPVMVDARCILEALGLAP